MKRFPRCSAVLMIAMCAVSACTIKEAGQGVIGLSRMLFGYVPPPQQTTVLEELRLEYDRCVAERKDEVGCQQIAYDTVRKVKGLDRQPLPSGVVIVREDGETRIKQAPPTEPAKN